MTPSSMRDWTTCRLPYLDALIMLAFGLVREAVGFEEGKDAGVLTGRIVSPKSLNMHTSKSVDKRHSLTTGRRISLPFSSLLFVGVLRVDKDAMVQGLPRFW